MTKLLKTLIFLIFLCVDPVMGIELFGAESGIYIGIACVVSYLFSGHTGIYASQIVGSPKHLIYGKIKGQHLK